MVRIKHFAEYLYSGEKGIPCAEHDANEWLKAHHNIKVLDVQTQYVEYPDEGDAAHSKDKMYITIVYEPEIKSETTLK